MHTGERIRSSTQSILSRRCGQINGHSRSRRRISGRVTTRPSGQCIVPCATFKNIISVSTRQHVDIGITDKTKIAWIVFAPGKVGKGALKGYYTGATAEATVGAGLGANVLVGGFKKGINLQPVSIQGQIGLNVAAGIGSLTLK